MRNRKHIGLSAVGVLLLSAAWVAAEYVPPVPATPAGIKDVLLVKPFTMSDGYLHTWRKEQPVVREGTLLVLSVDPALVFPRNTAEPVLYVGNQTAERINHGYSSGMVIAVVPGTVDLKTTPIWFGTPQLPEQVDQNTIQAERTLADKAGIKPLAASKIDAAVKLSGDPLQLGNRMDLAYEAAKLVVKYAPQDREFVEPFLTGGSK